MLAAAHAGLIPLVLLLFSVLFVYWLFLGLEGLGLLCVREFDSVFGLRGHIVDLDLQSLGLEAELFGRQHLFKAALFVAAVAG